MARLAEGGGKAVSTLENVIAGAAVAEARRNAVWVLTRIPGAEARRAARRALVDSDATVRQAATHSAGLWRDRDALSGLLAVLKRGPDAVRRSAAEAIRDGVRRPRRFDWPAGMTLQVAAHVVSLAMRSRPPM